MTRPIVQSITFKASAKQLYAMFTDSKLHSAATGAKAQVSSKAGADWKAFDGMILGRNLQVIPGKRVVQAWRSSNWPKSDRDSILIVEFSDTRAGGKVELVHVGVPQHDHAGVIKGWRNYYWKPWRAYLKRKMKSGD